VAIEKDVEGCKKILNYRKNKLEQALDNIQKETHNVMRGLENLGPEIQKLIEKTQKKDETVEEPTFQQSEYDGMGA
jgi:prefoldin subunit 5